MQENVKKLLEKQGYRIIGGHSAVKTCHWLKESLINNRSCYKEKFYGIKSHRCLQMTPSVAWCQHRCVFCWRPIEHTIGSEMEFEADDPNFIIENAIKEQRRLLSGYWGNEKVDESKLKQANDPRHAAISLAGEPTTYPMIGDLIENFHSRGFTTYLVTNGMKPKVLEEIEKPTQLYLSLEAYDRKLYKRINNPQVKDGWERLNKSLEILNSIKTKKVVRITLVRGFNLDKPKKFAPLIEKAQPDYVEPKGYVHVGYSRRRLLREDMPSFEEVQRFAVVLSEETGYDIKDSSKDSKVVLLS
ncbi:MAG: 4-demethylwyosine synthase TYW1, partial [Candidatus Hydrothermarchaeales archaeon]